MDFLVSSDVSLGRTLLELAGAIVVGRVSLDLCMRKIAKAGHQRGRLEALHSKEAPFGFD